MSINYNYNFPDLMIQHIAIFYIGQYDYKNLYYEQKNLF